jgi:hypothetical protein
MSTSRNRRSVQVLGTQDPCNLAALLLILELDHRDIQQGNYCVGEAFFDELDRESSGLCARKDGDR